MLLHFEHHKHRLAKHVSPSDAEYKGAARYQQDSLPSREHDNVLHVPIPFKHQFRGVMHHLHSPKSNRDPDFFDIYPLRRAADACILLPVSTGSLSVHDLLLHYREGSAGEVHAGQAN